MKGAKYITLAALKGVFTVLVAVEALILLGGSLFALLLAFGLGIDNHSFFAAKHLISAITSFALAFVLGMGVAALWEDSLPFRWVLVLLASASLLAFNMYWVLHA